MGSRGQTGWRRHFEGWQLVALSVFLAGSVAALAVPRPVDPSDLPDPTIDPRSLDRIASADAARAAAAAREGLDVDVRALGSAVRAYGRADAGGDLDAGLEARGQALLAAKAAIRLGDEPTLRLRAYQLASFVREVRRWEATGKESDELREVGGGFVHTLQANGWTELAQGKRRILVDAPALAALYKKRWNDLVGISGGPFDLAIDEQRALYRFLLRHPVGDMRRGSLEQHRLKKIEELAALDSTYPADLARGIVLYHLGRYPAAVEKFRLHLESAPDGPWTLRAQNYLRAALGRARDENF